MLTGIIALTAMAACGGSGSTAVVTPPVVDLAYSAWRKTPGMVGPVGVEPAADPANLYVAKALTAYDELTAYWSGARVAPRIRTFWYVPAAAPIGGATFQTGLYLTDSLPASGASGAQPAFQRFGWALVGGSV